MSIIWRNSYHKRSAAFHMVRLFANQSKILFLHNLFGALFWDYSGIRIHGIGGNCVLLGPILIPEWRNSALFGINRIAGNRACVLLAIVACLSAGKLHTEISSVSSQFLSRQLFCFQNITNSVLLETDIVSFGLFRNRNSWNKPNNNCSFSGDSHSRVAVKPS